MRRSLLFLAAPLALFSSAAAAQANRVSPAAGSTPRSDPATLPDSILVRALSFRSIGPAVMSGRISDIAVTDNGKPARGKIGNVIYAATATGGVWRSTNAGVTWAPIFDSVRTGGVGAVAVAPSNPNVIWVGTGESNNMRSSSWGTGVYKSADGGKTWSSAMLAKSQHVGKIVIDPRDPNVVYVAALGPLWGPGGDRGLYKTTDGGKTWSNTKEISKYTGFGEVAMDPSNPDVLYAASQMRERREYGFLPAGPESRIYKTTDAARTWTELKGGLPSGDVGRIGLGICKSRPNTVYAMVHAKPPGNGLYRSDDGGTTWAHVNDQNGTAWYYSQVYCDPTDPDHIVTLNANSRESRDGGKTFTPFAPSANNGPHTDHHALWFNEDNPQHIILGSDGGLYQTWDAGRTWDHVESIVAGQYYAIAVDDAQPFYNVYGGLQDNQTWGGPSRTRNAFGPTNADWFRMHGGDGFFAVPNPFDRQIVYAESQQGGVVRYDERTGQAKNIKPVPKPGERHRYNWSTPILPSRYDANTLYLAANYLFKSSDRGDTWQVLGADLTRAIDRNKLPMRGAIPDSGILGRNEGTAEFSNITTVDESPVRRGLLVVGTDDGLIQVSRDDGKTWKKTDRFPGVPDTTFVSRVIWSKASEGTIFATFDGHRSNDFKPYVVKSTDYGQTWTSITSNLPEGSVQVIREHPRQPNLLFVGSEFGVFTSIDGGARWTQLKSGIPGVPVYDIQIQARANDLVLGTHGRSIYILDDLTPLEYLAKGKQSDAFMFPIQDALLFQPNTSRNSGMGTRGFAGQNPDPGARISYLLNTVPADAKVTLAIVDGSGTMLRELPASKQPGMYRVTWNMRVGPPFTGPAPDTTAGRGGRGGGRGGQAAGPDSTGAGRGGGEGDIEAGGGGGGRGNADNSFPVVPGKYVARLTIAPASGTPTVLEQSFSLTKDPMVTLSDAELRALNAFRLDVSKAQRSLREKQAQLDTANRLFAAAKRAADSAGTKVTPALKTQLAAVEKELADLTRDIGAPAGAGGRGGRGGGAGGGAPAGGRGGRGAAPVQPGGRGAPPTGAPPAGGPPVGGDDQNPAAATAPQTVQARLATTTEMLNISFNPSPDQKKTIQALPADLLKQGDRINKVAKDQLPALIKALRDAGVEIRPAP